MAVAQFCMPAPIKIARYYRCGRYMRTSGDECASNQVDAEAMLRFTLNTLQQVDNRNGNREKLRQKLMERALLENGDPTIDPMNMELSRLQSRESELTDQRNTIEYR